MIILLVIALAAVIITTEGSTLQPPVLPLIVRNPYLSVWLGNARGNPWERWPIFWTGQEVGLGILISVPEIKTVFPLFGRPHDSLANINGSFAVSYPDYLGTNFDASTTNLTYKIPASKIGNEDTRVTLSFLSPITPTSTLRQSIPASYLSVHITGSSHIDLYIDINGLWVSGNGGSEIVWDIVDQVHEENSNSSSSLRTWRVKKKFEQLFTEEFDRSEWGSIYFSAPDDVKYEAGSSTLLRQKFFRTGTLENLVDNNFRSILNEEPVFAFAKSFKINTTNDTQDFIDETVTFTVAHIQDPVIKFASARGLTFMKPLWATYYHTPEDLIRFHYYDFEKVSSLADNYSRQLEIDALNSGSADYKDIVALSARQVMGACTFAGAADEPMIFLKEISSDGNINTVDVIYPAFPFFLYTNPKWLAWLIEPLIEHMLSGQYPNDYSMHDIGSNFPNATGHPDGRDEYMPLEECGNMLIMGLALINSLRYDSKPASIWSAIGEPNHAESTSGKFTLHIDVAGMDDTFGGPIYGDRQARVWIERSYPLLKQWTGYLIREALIPANQLSTDDFAGWLSNQTNLALKGIIGIRAMADISNLVGEEEDAQNFLRISQNYIDQWQKDFAISRDGSHAKLAYTWFGSWTTLYNLFADSLLCFHLPRNLRNEGSSQEFQTVLGVGEQKKSRTKFIHEKIYRRQSEWYHSVRQRYGLPLDSRHLYAKSDWEFFAVAVSSRQVREEIVQSVALWVNETSTDAPLTDLYDTEGTGGYPGFSFKARPVVGGHFAFLALERACEGKAVQALSFLDIDDSRESQREGREYL